MRAVLVLVARLALARGFGYLPDSMDGCVDSMCEDGYTCATRYDRQYYLPPLCVGLSGNGWVRGGARAVVGLHPAGILLVRLGAW